ncbi:TPA: hypothetical protein N2C38_006413, partial [Pseudomonas aeruginosa]|nr:hypothetical protein [Pseudomonas aeruginosa]
DTVRRLRDALGKDDWFSELFALSGLAWAVAEIIVVKINLSPFSLESVEITGAKVSNKITDARFPGIVEYSYQLPRTNTKGEFIGGYKSVSTKTTYDPKILPDSKVADMSSRAAVQAESVFKANPALRETSIKVDGYYFQVTRNSKTGEITNSFIAMPPRIK